MPTFSSLEFGRRRGSVLLPTLFVVVVIVILLSALLPLTVTGYGVARADRDRAAALAAAEAGLNWEIGRINNRLWGKDDSGNSVMTVDNWPDSTTSSARASTVVLMTDASGNWTQRFLAGTSTNPFNLTASGSFAITAEGQVRAADGEIVKRRVRSGGGSLFSLFDSGAIFAFSTSTSSLAPAWSMSGNCSVVGGCGSNGLISGSGNPRITVGPLGLWGPNASIAGVTISGVPVVKRPTLFTTDTADKAASNLPLTGTGTGGTGVARWSPSGYDANGNCLGPANRYGRIVNSQAQIVNSAGTVLRSVAAREFVDSNGYPVLDHHLKDWSGQNRLRLRPGVYYLAQISLTPGDTVEVDDAYYQADGKTPLAGAGTAADYNSDGNRITIFVDSVPGYATSAISSGLYTTLQGSSRRPGNFRIYARNTGDFQVGGSNSGSFEFNANLLHYNQTASGSYYGSIVLDTGCSLYGGLFGWTVTMKGGATVQQSGAGVFSGNDPVAVVPTGGGANGRGGGVGGGFGAWQWQEIVAG